MLTGTGMLNVLFVLYHDFTANSAVHVFHLANHLTKLGPSCAVAVPNNPESVSVLGSPDFAVHQFDDLRNGIKFPNGRGPDLVHAWTPRENVRQFCQKLRSLYSFRQFIHLEDNEWHLLSSMLNRPWKTLSAMSPSELYALMPGNLSHPVYGKEFLESADGVTVIIDRLREFVPPHVPVTELWPSAPANSFLMPSSVKSREALGIPEAATVLVYNGNAHAANAREVRSLYLAVAILNREGHPAVLVRAGRDSYPFLGPDDTWARAHSIELGYVPHTEIPALLSLADILVQPGRSDPFNDYRFPSKVPEFLAAGRPVVLPATNIGLRLVHGVDAFVLPKVDALAIVDAVRSITIDQDLYDRLARGGREFFEQHLSWDHSARKLLNFYEPSRAAARVS
ncbi:MAG: glycosyltransferase [Bryobacterales bacterium]|nr:glycosyltransferase [Bryobacterales bacterium]